MLRAVLDVNVLVSALLTRHGSPARVLRSWTRGAFELVVSAELLAEFTAVTARQRFGPDIGHAGSALATLLATDALVADDPPPAARWVPADEADDYLVSLALATGAHVIVAGDRHLLDADLGDGAPRVLTPSDFLALLGRLGV